ncbi:MATE family efflux transporter, partial [Streptococcus parasanguinis]|nr:MATE family efflux transporter [Streptococcus parasanguinis]
MDRKISYPHFGDNSGDNPLSYPHTGHNLVDSLGITFRAHNRCLRNAVRRDMRVSVPIDSS